MMGIVRNLSSGNHHRRVSFLGRARDKYREALIVGLNLGRVRLGGLFGCHSHDV
jgi:hypothetical protein